MTFQGTRKMLRPLTILTDSMAHFNQDDMGMRFVVASEDETGRLVASFNKMMDIINQLIESEYEGKVRLKEAELKQQRIDVYKRQLHTGKSSRPSTIWLEPLRIFTS